MISREELQKRLNEVELEIRKTALRIEVLKLSQLELVKHCQVLKGKAEILSELITSYDKPSDRTTILNDGLNLG